MLDMQLTNEHVPTETPLDEEDHQMGSTEEDAPRQEYGADDVEEDSVRKREVEIK